MKQPTTINIFGLGKIGSILALLFANEEIKINGFDPNTKVLENYLSGIFPEMEPDSHELVAGASNKISINPNLNTALMNSRFSLVIVPTPSNADGTYSLEYLKQVVIEICKNLGDDSEHVIVIKSTVLPGDLAKLDQIAQSLTRAQIHFVYNPEFIALGEVVKNMTHPNLVLIGANDFSVGQEIANLNKLITKNLPSVEILDIQEAELAKIALNTFVTMKISFANLIGMAAKNLGSFNPGKVLSAIGNDPRIGKMYLKPGLGYGGPCFPRDNRALASTLKDLGLNPSLPTVVDEINNSIPSTISQEFLEYLNSSKSTAPILVVGATYKPGTPEFVESQPLQISQKIAANVSAKSLQLDIYDPQIPNEALKTLLEKANHVTDIEKLGTYQAIFMALPIVQQEILEHHLIKGGKIINPWS